MRVQPEALNALLAGVILSNAAVSFGQSTEEMNAANNPLQPVVATNVQDQYVDSLYGLEDADSNALLLRATTPHKLFGEAQILRTTLPIVTTPDLPPSGGHTDLGDLNLFDLLLFKTGHSEIGIGPQLTMPTAARDETGTGKWQAGIAAAAIAPQEWGVAGGLITWQHSFAGDDDRRTQNNLQVQPFLIRNFSRGWYLRSTAAWTWDLDQDTYYMPLGLGLGKVWKVNKATCNLFAEPQWTAWHDGEGVPKFQVFAGVNLQFPL